MKALALFFGVILCSVAQAGDGLVIHSAEFGVGKFHRYDNKQHPYGEKNAWSPYILPDGADTTHPLTRKNTDGSFTIFFSTLDDLIGSVSALAQNEHKKVALLNVHGHGLPGAMWFPKDEADLRGLECWEWNNAANGADENNYDQYYSPVSSAEIQQMRQLANNNHLHLGCTVGLREWQEGVAKAPGFKDLFAAGAQIHFLSCIVGLGSRGESFTQGISALLLAPTGHAYTSMNFGLGDWSMPNGMGFWDMQSEEQVRRDGALYSAHKRDSEIAQKGRIRMSTFNGGNWGTGMLANRDVLSLHEESTQAVAIPAATQALDRGPVPAFVRVPGTNARVSVRRP
jgi:hypothetical protein